MSLFLTGKFHVSENLGMSVIVSTRRALPRQWGYNDERTLRMVR
jgi:hypothetical protein